MATKTYNVTAPDGTALSFDGPDDASNADVLAAAQRAYSASIKIRAAKMTADDASPLEAGVVATGRVFDKAVSGVKQAYYGLTGDKAGQAALAEQEGDAERTMGALDKAHPVATAVGTAVPYLATAPLSAETLLGRAAVQGVANAVPGAISYGTEGERATNAGIGAAGGAGGTLAGALVGKAVGAVARPFGTPAQDVAAAADRLSKQGIDLTPAQASGSPFLTQANAALDKLPISGKLQQAKAAQTQGQINQAVAKTFGSTATTLDDKALKAARNNLGAQFDALSARNTVSAPAVNQLVNDFGTVVNDAVRNKAGDIPRIVANTVDDVLSKVEASGTIPGEAYKSLDSQIGLRMRQTTNGELRSALGEVRDKLRNAMDASISPQDAAQWATVRNQYANMMTASKAADFATGNISVPKLVTAVTSRAPNVKFNGGGVLGDLAKDLKLTVGNGVNSSGTAERAYYTSLLSGKHLGALAAGAGPLAHFPQLWPAYAASAVGSFAIPPAAQATLNSQLVKAVAMKGIPAVQAAKLPLSVLTQLAGQGIGGVEAEKP